MNQKIKKKKNSNREKYFNMQSVYNLIETIAEINPIFSIVSIPKVTDIKCEQNS